MSFEIGYSYSYNNGATNKKLSTIDHDLTLKEWFQYNAKGLLKNMAHEGEPFDGEGFTSSQNSSVFQPNAYGKGGNDVMTDFTYDDLNRISGIDHYLVPEDDEETFYSLNYTYNDAGMITQIYGQRDDESYERNYTYDDVYRLTSEEDEGTTSGFNWKFAYEYDPAGNRTDEFIFSHPTISDHFTMEYNDFNQLTLKADAAMGFASTNNILSPFPITYTYDLNGNLISDSEVNTYIHNRENRFVERSDSSPKSKVYVYDFSGRLLLSDYDGAKEKYYYDGINRLLTREQAGGATPCWRTISANTLKDAAIGQMIAETKFSYSTASCDVPPTIHRVWYEYDHIGNPVATVDGNANIGMIDMTAFGKVQSGGHDGPRLTTKHYDATSGLYYFGARWYDPEIGTFLEKSPYFTIWEHSYVSNNSNPLKFTDPSGKIAVVSGGTPAQNKLAQDAYNKACGELDCKWDPSKIPPGADPNAVKRLKSCLGHSCKNIQPIKIGGPFCGAFDIQGYTTNGPINPFGGEGDTIHLCPNYVFSGEDGGPSNVTAGTIMHEMAHNCGVGENWAGPVGDMFF